MAVNAHSGNRKVLLRLHVHVVHLINGLHVVHLINGLRVGVAVHAGVPRGLLA